MIVWCRERAAVTVEQVADKLALADRDVMFWEFGVQTPTLPQLRALAKFLRFPTAVFYLPNPPQWHPVRDFRKLPSPDRGVLSRELAYWTRITQGRQEWLAEYLESHGREPLPFVGRSSYTESPIDVGKRLRNLLGVSLEEQKALPDKQSAFRYWRSQCEAAGVSVFLSRKVPLSEMRGFALAHEVAPIVVVNDRDRFGGRIFTLMHEMAHVMLNISGISDRAIESTANTDDEKIEVFCNAVAAEALVPSEDFIAVAKRGSGEYEQSLPSLAAMYRVSQEVIARKLLQHGFINHHIYERLVVELRQRGEWRKDKRRNQVRIKQATIVLSTVGRRFGKAVVSAYREDRITGPDVSDLLSMKSQFLPDLEKRLVGE